MPRFFSNDVNKNEIKLSKEDSAHIKKSLRMREGEEIIISDGEGNDYNCRLFFDNESAYGKIENISKNESEPSVNITLYQAVPKSDKMEFIIKKATELGVKRIVPVITQYCIKRPSKEKQKKLNIRYNKIAKEAAKQSGRGVIPVVEDVVSFKDAVKKMNAEDTSILFYESNGNKIEDMYLDKCKSIGVMIGSEGGFSSEEINFACENNIEITNLGKRVLRCETAPIVALTILLINTKNF